MGGGGGGGAEGMYIVHVQTLSPCPFYVPPPHLNRANDTLVLDNDQNEILKKNRFK